MGSASLLTMANAIPAVAQGMVVAQAEEIPETVLITGSLIRGTAAVGVPVTNLSPQDFAMTGALTTSELFRTFPAANVSPGPVATMSGANIERATRVNLRGLDSGNAPRSLMMIDGMRFPGQGNGLCEIDPSVIPALALDHIDILMDGASATYGSDAIGGVINLILKRNMDGAITQLRYTTAAGGKNRYLASAIWGRTWDGGQVTLSYEWYDESPIMGNAHSNFTIDFSPWGLDDRRNLGSSTPGTLSTGAPAQPGGGRTTSTHRLRRLASAAIASPTTPILAPPSQLPPTTSAPRMAAWMPMGGGGTYACNIQGYSNIEPSFYTFDLSVGYNTMDTPANEYLRNIAVRVVIQNITDRRSPFEYRISTGGGNPVAMDLLKNNQGRTISLILTKQ